MHFMHFFSKLTPEAWTAVFTAGLFVATVGLFVATYALFRAASQESEESKTALAIAQQSADASLKAAEAAERQVSAAIAVQLPVLRFGVPTLQYVDEPVASTGPYTSIDAFDRPRKHNIVSHLGIVNEGKTECALELIYLGWVIGGFHDSPRYGHMLLNLPSIAPSSVEQIDCGPFNLSLTDEATKAIASGKTLHFFCRVDYRDFMGECWTQTATWAWKQPTAGGGYTFERAYDAPSGYNDRKKRQ